MKMTDKECVALEGNKHEDDLVAREIHIQRQDVVIAELRYNLAVLKSEVKMQQLKVRKEEVKNKRVAIIDPIKERLGIEGSFGFDPDTLEVITNEEE